MSIAEKLVTIAENEQKVYDTGYNVGYSKGCIDGNEEGMSGVYNSFWNIQQENGNRVDYKNAFGGSGWTIENFKPKYDMNVTNGYMMFKSTKMKIDLVAHLEALGVVLNTSNATTIQYLFTESWFTRVGVIDMTKLSNTGDTFSYCYYLETIDKLIVQDNMVWSTNTFVACKALKNITIEGTIGNSLSLKDCELLTYDSSINILNALKNYSGTNTTKTLTLHATAKAQLTDPEIAWANQKGWTIA